MLDYARDIDLETYNTFFLEYVKSNDVYSTHTVRPCKAFYRDVVKTDKSIILEAAVLSFTHNSTIAEILLECSLRGISLDFIEMLVDAEKDNRWGEYKCVRVIDLHKEDISDELKSIEAPRHYIALDRKKNEKLKFLVVDRFAQGKNIKFLNGKYDKDAIVAKFKDCSEAKQFCEKVNRQ